MATESVSVQTPSENGWKPSTVEEWRARSLHRVAVNTAGVEVLLRLRTPGELLAQGDLPDKLANIAVLEATRDVGSGGAVGAIAAEISEARAAGEPDDGEHFKRAREMGEDLAEFVRRLVAFSLVEPQVTAEDLAHPDFPMRDLELLAAIINRQTGFDAIGRRIGVEPLDTFRVVGRWHSCPEGCEKCAGARMELSSVHEGQM